jgi:Ca-activated chloride channel homolog
MRMTVFLACWILLGSALAAQVPLPVTLETVTGRKFYREGSDNEIAIETRIAVVPPSPAATPSVRNIAFVLDRSGSMAGEPIEALRRATIAALGTLADSDIVTVILFGSEVETLLEAQRRDRLGELEARIPIIEPAGGAALYDALNQAAAQLRRHAAPATLDRIVLVTDGPPTKGLREIDDFARLGEVFAREGIAVSTLGLGPDFPEDMLAAMARTSHGQYRYIAQPAALADALRAEIAPQPVVVGRDAVLTLKFRPSARKLRSYAWREAHIDSSAIEFRYPRLTAGQSLRALVTAQLDAFYTHVDMPDFATVKLRWTDLDGEPREIGQTVRVRFSTNGLELREPFEVGVARSAADAAIREGLQKAIEAIDQNDPRRALRVLRSARSSAIDLNFDLDDARIVETVRHLDAFLAEQPPRTWGPLDRKILRSGLFNRFDPPAKIVESKN